MTRPFTVSGTVTKFFWANPHSYIDLDVPMTTVSSTGGWRSRP